MHDIELFHYYRQDVISSCYDGRRFFKVGRNNEAVLTLSNVMKHVRAIVAECRSDYDCVEEYAVLSSSQKDKKKEYRVCIFGEGGEIGFFFRICIPFSMADKIQARGSPPRDHYREKRITVF